MIRIIVIIVIIVIHIVFVFSKWPKKKHDWESRKDFAERRIVYLGEVLKILPFLAYFVYSVHCMRAGGCEAFAWFQMVPVLYIYIMIISNMSVLGPFFMFKVPYAIPLVITFSVYHFLLARCMRTGGCGAFARFRTAVIVFFYFFYLISTSVH